MLLTAGVSGGVLILFLAVTGVAGSGSVSPATRGTLDIAAYFRDGPPARVTGGFGEETCFACHFDGSLNDGKHALVLAGVPDRYAPGETYRLELSLTRPELAVGGFQLTARLDADGSQAGRLEVPPEEKGRLAILTEDDVQFAHHRAEGIELVRPDTARWVLRWTSPDAAGSEDRVVIHIAAVAGNGDDSQFGDDVYTLEVTSFPRARRSRR